MTPTTTRTGGRTELETIVVLALVTFGLGVLLGFVGAGGAGLAVALLTAGFHLPVHQAIGTALAAMCFVSVSGAISHYREGNVAPRAGLVVGLAGMVGAVAGANVGQGIPEEPLKLAAGLGLWLLAALVWLRTRLADRVLAIAGTGLDRPPLLPSVGLGLTGGAAAAFLGVGMAPFLQLGLLVLLKLPLRQTVGTTMLTLAFISLSGSVSLALHGDVSVPHLIGTTLGLASGSYLGARYTGRARREVLRAAVVGTPLLAGSVLIFF